MGFSMPPEKSRATRITCNKNELASFVGSGNLLNYRLVSSIHTKTATDAKSRAPPMGSVSETAITALVTASVNVPKASAAAEEMTGTSDQGSEQLSNFDFRFRWNAENSICQMKLISLEE